jgi:uncharacterized membrane protein
VTSRHLTTLERLAVYGIAGWCLEIVFTAVSDKLFNAADFKLKGYSYLWMPPIWAAGIYSCEQAYIFMRRRHIHWTVRIFPYVAICFATEYTSGAVLRFFIGDVPWHYHSAWAIDGLIRLDYAPFWALFGLIGERASRFLWRLRIHVPPDDENAEPPPG